MTAVPRIAGDWVAAPIQARRVAGRTADLAGNSGAEGRLWSIGAEHQRHSAFAFDTMGLAVSNCLIEAKRIGKVPQRVGRTAAFLPRGINCSLQPLPGLW